MIVCNGWVVTIASPGSGSHEPKGFFLTKNGWDQLSGFDLKVYGSRSVKVPRSRTGSVGRVILSGFASRGIKLRPLDKPIPGKVPEMTCPIFGYNFRAWGMTDRVFFSL